MLGNTERRIALVILVTALLPLGSAMLLAYWLLNYASSVWIRPEVDQELEHGIDLYKQYVGAVKDDMKSETAAIAGDEALREAARKHDGASCAHALERLFPQYPQLVSLTVEDDQTGTLAEHDRGRPLDEATERRLEVRRTLGNEGSGPTLVARFAFDRRYERELERAGEVHEAYSQL
ncbi:MAG: hypothetical protein JOZ69_20700, partial [Myxococcales bacterium]|nr:hypothetical protein [Myxococcales bacterium]